jgi:7,8-dihydropterin-6-yl-methyl-4-(beta-D-ribofuranosyl)aminobenzene 5'-phosphate synthase
MINLKLKVLVDNSTFIDRYFLAEPAISFYIEDGEKKILFDVGYSNAYIRNAEKMGINLRKLDYVVLSHGHSDHTWGMESLIRLYSEANLEGLDFRKPTVIAHPDLFQPKLLNGEDIGSLLSGEKIAQHFKLTYSKEPNWLTDQLVFLSEIPRQFHFEGQDPIGRTGMELKDDYLLDDSALVYKTEKGLVVIVACSHAGICNTIEYAKKVCQEERIVDIIGGFHLLQPSEKQIKHTVAYFKSLNPDVIHACHCTDFSSKVTISDVANVKEVGVGLQLEY